MTRSVIMFIFLVGLAELIIGFLVRLATYRWPNSAIGQALAVIH